MGVIAMRAVARKRVRLVMAIRNLTTNDLAEMTGYTTGYLRGVIAGAFGSTTAQQKIEQALHTPIWSDLETESTPN